MDIKTVFYRLLLGYTAVMNLVIRRLAPFSVLKLIRVNAAPLVQTFAII